MPLKFVQIKPMPASHITLSPITLKTILSVRKLLCLLSLSAVAAFPSTLLAEGPNTSTPFAFNHFQQQLGSGMFGAGEQSSFKGIFHSYDNVNYGGISLNKRSANGLEQSGKGAVFNYGFSITENSEDYKWQLDSYLSASYELALSSNTQASLGISLSVNGLPYRIFFNDDDNKVATAYSVGPLVGIRHQIRLAQGQTLTPFGHYFYSSQSISSRSLWNIFADAFTDPEKDRSVHDYQDVIVLGATADLHRFLITPAYVKNDANESWHIGIGVSY